MPRAPWARRLRPTDGRSGAWRERIGRPGEAVQHCRRDVPMRADACGGRHGRHGGNQGRRSGKAGRRAHGHCWRTWAAMQAAPQTAIVGAQGVPLQPVHGSSHGAAATALLGRAPNAATEMPVARTARHPSRPARRRRRITASVSPRTAATARHLPSLQMQPGQLLITKKMLRWLEPAGLVKGADVEMRLGRQLLDFAGQCRAARPAEAARRTG